MKEQTEQVNMKTPEFMETAVDGWFTILKTQFYLWNATALKIKICTVVSSLPVEEVAKLPNATLESLDFEKLKRTLIEAHEKMKPELLENLMSATIISRRP